MGERGWRWGVIALLLPGMTPVLCAMDAGVVAGNFQVLLLDRWKDVGRFLLWFTVKTVAGGALAMVAGFVLALLLYFLIRRRRWFECPFRWYRFFRWLWLPVFLLSITAGCAVAGLWIGGGMAARDAIRKDLVLRKVVASLYCAVAFDRMHYQVKGTESAESLVAMLENAGEAGPALMTDIGRGATEFYDREMAKGDGSRIPPQARGFLRKIPLSGTVLNVLNSPMARDALWEKTEGNPRLVLALLYLVTTDRQGVQAFLAANPDAKPAAQAVNTVFAQAEQAAVGTVNGLVLQSVLVCLALGAGIPFLLLGGFRLTLWFVARRQPPCGCPPAAAGGKAGESP